MKKLVLSGLLALGMAGQAQAIPITLNGVFSASNITAIDGGSVPYDPVSGSFSFIFDDAITNTTQALSSLTSYMFSMTLGSTVFDETNTDGGFVLQDDGDIVLTLFGTANGGQGVQDFTDDFLFSYAESTNVGPSGPFTSIFDLLHYTAVSSDDFFVAGNNFGVDVNSQLDIGISFTPVDTVSVPEPGTWALLGLGALGLIAARRRRPLRTANIIPA